MRTPNTLNDSSEFPYPEQGSTRNRLQSVLSGANSFLSGTAHATGYAAGTGIRALAKGLSGVYMGAFGK